MSPLLQSPQLYVYTLPQDSGGLQLLQERPEAKGRFLLAAGSHSNKEIATILRSTFPDRASKIPIKLPAGIEGDGYPVGGAYGVNTTKSTDILCIKYRSLEETLVDFVKSIEPLEAKA